MVIYPPIVNGAMDCTNYTISLDSGEIRHENYQNDEDLEWTISANCPMVNLVSIAFETEEGYDYVTIAGIQYDGSDSLNINVPTSTIVQFHSDGSATQSGFVLEWTCVTGNSQYNRLTEHIITLFV